MFYQSYKIRKQKGFSTLEILLALTLAVMFLSAVLFVSFGNQSLALDSQTDTEAQSKALELLEKQQANARKDFALVNPLPVPPATFIQDDIYKKTVTVTQPDFFTKKVTANVTWTGDHNRPQTVSLSTIVTNPDAVSGGNTCNSVLSGDWTNPQKMEYEFGRDILNDTSSGFPVTSVQTYNHKMYVTVNNDNGNNPGTFFVLDISDPTIKPILLTPSNWDNSTVGAGLNSVAVDGGNYAYVANGYGAQFTTCTQAQNCNQMQVINVSVNPPVVVTNYKVPGVTGNGGQGIGKSIFFKNGVVFLGLAKAGGSTGEFVIIDVGGGGTPGASPLNPVMLGSLEFNSAINSIYVKGNYAYVASPDNEELKVLDISVLSNPHRVGGFDAPGGGANNGNGKSMALVGDRLYFGRTLLNGNELYILNNSVPASNLTSLGSKDIQDLSANNISVTGIIVRDYLAFLITDGEFQIFRIDNPGAINQYTVPLVLPPGSGNIDGTAVDCEGNYIFVGSMGSNDKGYISVITGG